MPKTITDIIIKIPEFIIKLTDLNFTDKLILSQIDFLNNEQGCTINNKTLGKYVGKTARTVQIVIAKLERLGYITRTIIDRYQRTIITTFEKISKPLKDVIDKAKTVIEGGTKFLHSGAKKLHDIYNKKQYKSFNNKIEEKQVLSLKLYQSSFTTIEEFESYCTEQEKRTDVIVDRIYSKLDKVSSNNSISALQQMKNGFNKIKLSCQNV